jgi:tripartite-type tricarboxylate transporter receptor subunit TctC
MTRFLSGIAMLALASGAFAQGYPNKPIRFLVAFAPGGPVDLAARLVSQKLPDLLGQQVVVDNRAGAGGNIGAAAVAKSPPDGYTALLTSSAVAVNMTLFSSPGYDAERDFVPVIQIATQPNMIIVNAAAPAKTLDELIKSARGTTLAYASPGAGTTPHLTAEMLFKVLAKLDTTAIHFKGAGPMVAAVVGGQPPLGSGAISGPLAQVRAGKLRALAVTTLQRAPAVPDLPTVAESGLPGFDLTTWFGVFVPAGTPRDTVAKLNAEIVKALGSKELADRLATMGTAPPGNNTPESFAAFVRTEAAKYAQVVKSSGARVD